MSQAQMAVIGVEVDLAELRKRWGWFLGLGVVLVLLGAVGVGASVFVTLATVVLFGWLLIAAGVLQSIQGLQNRRWSGFFLDLIIGLLYLVVGVLVILHPVESAVELTLVIAVLLIFGGVLRVVIAAAGRFPHWGWVLLNGAISIALGVMIYRRWPLDGLWVIGLFVGIEMMFNGWAMVMLGLSARNLPEKVAGAPA